jgi:hypothetical protein
MENTGIGNRTSKTQRSNGRQWSLFSEEVTIAYGIRLKLWQATSA